MTRDIHQAVRDACLWLPEAIETRSHGSATFQVRGKTFAYFTVNHHGDQRVALLVNLPAGAQEAHVGADPKRYFVPSYVGPRGWLGVQLDKRLPWARITALVRDAYEKVAPRDLRTKVPPTPVIEPPLRQLTAAEIDPLKTKRAQALWKLLRGICLRWPETSEVLQFGRPVWKVGKKSFAMLRADGAEPALCVWVGIENQNLLTSDQRFSIPPYIGHNGWIALEVGGAPKTDRRARDRDEIQALLLDSYRHFALRRMLAALERL